MQKIINVLALASSVVSLAVVGTGAYDYVNKEAKIESVKEKAMDSIMGGGAGLGALGGAAGGLGGDLPTGALDLSPQTNPDAAPQAGLGLPMPGSPF